MHDHNSKFAYSEAEYEEIPCDLCGGSTVEALGFSRGGNARGVICRTCGLIFISPRMTKRWYDLFYQEEYRTHSGAVVNLDRIFEGARLHGRALARDLRPYLFTKGLLLDVGSSVGGVCAGMKDALGVEVAGIEPSAAEAAFANAHGIPTSAALIEDVKNKGIHFPVADQIICTQSLNHFLSPRFFFTWAWQQLKPSGRLILEVKNFRQQARRSGRVENSIQLDHVYMFTPETVRQYLVAGGFRIVADKDDELLTLAEIRQRQKLGLPAWQIRVVAEKIGKANPFADVASAIDPHAYAAVRNSLKKSRLAFHRVFRLSRFGEVASPQKLTAFFAKKIRQ